MSRYDTLQEKRNLPRALMGGTAEMRRRGAEFLPQHPAEQDKAYKIRLGSTTLYNGFQDTVKKMAGKPFGKPVMLNDDVPQSIADLMPNIDGAGRNLTSFAYDVFENAIVDGISFIHVDHPVVKRKDGQQATMADQKAQGARPFTVLIEASQLIEWKSENVNGVCTLTKAAFIEVVDEIEQKRVLLPGRFEIYRKNELNEWILFDFGVTSLKYIPLVPVYINRVGFFEGEPPLTSLADLNQDHWISSSEQRKAATYARFAMLHITGVDNTTGAPDVGPDKVLMTPLGTTAQYIETSGAALEAGRLDLEAIEKRMQHVGMTVRIQTPAGVTATAARIDSKDGDSALVAAVESLIDSLNNVLQVMADYTGLPTGGSVSVNKSFSDDVPVGTQTDVREMYGSGMLTLETALVEMQRRNVLAASVDIKTEAAVIRAMPLGRMV